MSKPKQVVFAVDNFADPTTVEERVNNLILGGWVLLTHVSFPKFILLVFNRAEKDPMTFTDARPLPNV